jgi:hypothetical protein
VKYVKQVNQVKWDVEALDRVAGRAAEEGSAEGW